MILMTDGDSTLTVAGHSQIQAMKACGFRPVATQPITTPRRDKPAASSNAGGAPRASATRKAWAEYAETVGVDPDGMTRAQIQAAVGAA